MSSEFKKWIESLQEQNYDHSDSEVDCDDNSDIESVSESYESESESYENESESDENESENEEYVVNKLKKKQK